MRFMAMVRSAEHQGPPPRALLDAMAEQGGEMARRGIMVDTGGLAPTAAATRVRVAGGKLTVLDGPYAEAKEVIGGYAVLEVGSKEEAVEAARWLMQQHLEHWPGWEGETEVRQIAGPPGGGER